MIIKVFGSDVKVFESDLKAFVGDVKVFGVYVKMFGGDFILKSKKLVQGVYERVMGVDEKKSFLGDNVQL